VGRDRDQDQVRSFRLSRITSSVEPGDAATGPPDGFVAADHIAGPWETAEDDGPPARVAVSERVAWWAIRSLREARLAQERPDGWIVVEAPGQPNLETWVLGLGREAEVLEPEELRTSVRAQLERIAGV
jgi:predicted DNA-binding transcriptional regulator YafY